MDIKDYLLKYYIEQNGETITEELARGLVQEFPITDGSDRKTGEKYTPEEARTIGDKYGVNWDYITPPEYYLVLNNMYSDYYPAARKRGINDASFFADLAQCWFDDIDGKDNKTFKYFFS